MAGTGKVFASNGLGTRRAQGPLRGDWESLCFHQKPESWSSPPPGWKRRATLGASGPERR